MILKGLFDDLDVGRLGRCGREGSERRECKEGNKSDRLAAPSRYNDFTPRHLSHGKKQYTAGNMAKSSLEGTIKKSRPFQSVGLFPHALKPNVR
jgi:hypothetical protein